MKRYSLLFTLLFVAMWTFANGDPVIEHSSMTVSRTPISRHIPEIQIAYERLDITPADQYTHIEVLYRLRNTSRRTFRNIHYGFPIDWYGTSDTITLKNRDKWTESQREVGWRDDYVNDVSFSIDGKQLPWKCSADSLLHEAHTWEELKQQFDSANNYYAYEEYIESEDFDSYDYENRLNRRWYYTTFSVPAGKTVELTVRYRLANNYTSSLYEKRQALQDVIYTYSGKYFYPSNTTRRNNSFAYDFSPASAWGNGKVDSLEVNIDMQAVVHDSIYPKYDSYVNYISGLNPDTLVNGNLRFRAADFDYSSSEPLRLNFMTTYKPRENLDYIFSHRLSSDQYTITIPNHTLDSVTLQPLSDMDFATAAHLPFSHGETEILIHFREPQYITGMLMLNGWCKDSITWQSSSKISKMQVWKTNIVPSYGGDQTFLEYGKTERKNPYSFDYDYYPAPCRLSMPKQFTWEGVIAEADMMNINPIRDWILLNQDGSRIEEAENEYYYNLLVTDIRIVVNETTGDAFRLSEIIFLTASPDESAFGTLIY